MKKIFLLLVIGIIILIISSLPVFAIIENHYSFKPDVSFLNITVNKGDEFSVEIAGKGWYANRYSRDKISILLRIVDNGKTVFNIKAAKAGEAYVFFSLLGQDKYLHIIITKEKNNKDSNGNKVVKEALSEQLKNIKTEDVNAENENTNKSEDLSSTKKNTVKKSSKTNVGVGFEKGGNIKENKKPEQVILNTEKSKEKIEQKQEGKAKEQKPENNYNIAKKKKEPEIYYIDNKSKEKVKIPIKDENKDYNEGIAEFKAGHYEKAIERLSTYIDKCKECKYREEAVFRIAKAYEATGNDSKAFEFYKKITEDRKGKYYVSAMKWIAEFYIRENNSENAMIYYQKLFNETKNPLIKRKIADIAYSNGDIAESIEGYNYCIKNGIVDDVILYRLASIYDSSDKYRDIEKAYKLYHKIVENYPQSKYFDISKKRVQFFEKNFINIR